MAENAANFTLTYQTKPSIFEVIAQKSLNDTLYPALQKIALVLATNFPNKFRWLNNYYEEAFLALNGLLQYHYLKNYDSSFSENFYGLKRVLSNNDCLTKHHRELSLIFLVIIPYFKKKLDEKVALIRIEHAEGSLRKDTEGRFKKLILFSHSSFEMVWCLITVHNYLKYMSDQTDFQTPIFKLTDMKLTYEMEQQENSGFWDALFRGNLSVSQLRFGLIKNAITTSLEIGAFFLQCVHMWNAQQSNYNITDLPNVPVPPHTTHEGEELFTSLWTRENVPENKYLIDNFDRLWRKRNRGHFSGLGSANISSFQCLCFSRVYWKHFRKLLH